VLADAKDVAILAAAIGAGAQMLVTHNIRHFRSGEGVRVVRPRTLIDEARAWMGSFGR
jgi:predicted nucleic acid-binding protein